MNQAENSKILAIDLKDGTKFPEIEDGDRLTWVTNFNLHDEGNDYHDLPDLPPGYKYTPLGMADKLSEEEAAKVMETSECHEFGFEDLAWADYLGGNGHSTALESLLSFLRASNLNPATTLIILKEKI